MGKWFTPEEIASWPHGTKKCRKCLRLLTLANFRPAPVGQKWLLNTSQQCKQCKSTERKLKYRQKHPQELKYKTYHGHVLSLEERAWVAGFLEGEGTFCATWRKDQNCPRVSLTAHQVNKEPLLRLAQICGGNVRGPYKQKNSKASPYYVWGTSGYEAYQYISAACWPYLSQKRREQISYGLSLFRKDTKSAKDQL